MLHQTIKRCFIIGPMQDMGRLHRFRDEVVKPLLEGFTVSTPDEGEIGNIMRQVLLQLEQADILIADITGNNPNVLYELGVYHCFGKPGLVVRDSSGGSSGTPFDIAEYRYHEIDFTQPAQAKEKLQPLLNNIIGNIDRLDWFSNPVTDFYQSPVAEIPTAIGLSKNYKKNFLGMILPAVFEKDEQGRHYRTDIWIQTAEADASGQMPMRPLTVQERDALQVHIYIPKYMHYAHHNYISGLKNTGRLPWQSAEVGRRTRPFRMHYTITEQGQVILADIPTVLSTLSESIRQRRDEHKGLPINAEDWQVLEQQELERFAVKCEQFKSRLEQDHPETQGRVVITWRWEV